MTIRYEWNVLTRGQFSQMKRERERKQLHLADRMTRIERDKKRHGERRANYLAGNCHMLSNNVPAVKIIASAMLTTCLSLLFQSFRPLYSDATAAAISSECERVQWTGQSSSLCLFPSDIEVHFTWKADVKEASSNRKNAQYHGALDTRLTTAHTQKFNVISV